jgi:hypothetical protein
VNESPHPFIRQPEEIVALLERAESLFKDPGAPETAFQQPLGEAMAALCHLYEAGGGADVFDTVGLLESGALQLLASQAVVDLAEQRLPAKTEASHQFVCSRVVREA